MAEITGTEIPSNNAPVKGQPFVVPTRDLLKTAPPPSFPASGYQDLPAGYDRYVRYLETGQVSSPKQLARDVEKLKDRVRYLNEQKSQVGRQLADYQTGYKEYHGSTAGMTETAQYQRLRSRFDTYAEEAQTAKDLRNDLIRLRQAYGERPPKPLPEEAPKPNYPYDYDPQRKILTLPSGETIGNVEGFTRTAIGELKEVIISEGGKKYTITAKTGDVTAVQDRKTHADLLTGEISEKQTGKALNLLLEQDYKKAKALGLDFEIPEEALGSTDWYYREAETQAKGKGAEALAYTIGQSLKGDATAYMTKVSKTPQGYLIEAQGAAATLGSYTETMEKLIGEQKSSFPYAFVEKLGEGRFLVRELPIKEPAYLMSKGFKGKLITSISLTEDLSEPTVEFDTGEVKRYSELTQAQKSAFDVNFQPILKQFETDLSAQLQSPPAFRQTMDTGVQFVKQKGNWKLYGLEYYEGEAPRQQFDFRQPYFKKRIVLPEGATPEQAIEAAMKARQAMVAKGSELRITVPGSTPEQAFRLYGLRSEAFYKSQMGEYEKMAAQYPSNVVAENIVKWAYGGYELIPKKVILSASSAGHELNKAITGTERFFGIDIPFSGNLSALEAQAVESKLAYESATLEAEATYKFRKFWFGDYLGNVRQGKIVEGYASYLASPPVVVGGSVVLAPYVKAPEALRSIPQAVTAAHTAGNLLKTFFTGSVTSVILEESAATLAVPERRPLGDIEEAKASFIAGGASSVVFSVASPVFYKLIPLGTKGAELVVKRSLSGGLSMGTSTAGYSVIKDFAQSKPIDIERASQYGAAGFAIGALTSPILGAIGDKYAKHKMETGKIEYELRPTDEVVYSTGEGTYRAQIFGGGKIKTPLGEVKIERLYGEAGFFEQSGGSVYSGEITATFAGEKAAVTYPVSGVVKVENLGTYRLGSAVSYGDDVFKVQSIYSSGTSYGKMGGTILKEFERGSKTQGSYFYVEPESGTYFKEMLDIGEAGRESILIKTQEGRYFQDIGSRYLMETSGIQTTGDDFAEQIGRKYAQALDISYLEPYNIQTLEIKKTLFGYQAIAPTTQKIQFKDITTEGIGRMYFVDEPLQYGQILAPEGGSYALYESSPLMEIPIVGKSPQGIVQTIQPQASAFSKPAQTFAKTAAPQTLQVTPKEVIQASKQAAQIAQQKQISLQMMVSKSPEITQAAKQIVMQKAISKSVSSLVGTAIASAVPAIMEETEYQVSTPKQFQLPEVKQFQANIPRQKIAAPTRSISAEFEKQVSGTRVSLIERPVQRKIEKPMERAASVSRLRPMERAIERPMERSIERAMERAVERPLERTIERAMERAIERPLERQLERTMERTVQPATPKLPPWTPPPTLRLPGKAAGLKAPRIREPSRPPRMNMEGVRTILADLVSVDRSLSMFGKATHPSPRKRPKIWEYETRRPGGEVPTVELLERKKTEPKIFKILKRRRKRRKGLL